MQQYQAPAPMPLSARLPAASYHAEALCKRRLTSHGALGGRILIRPTLGRVRSPGDLTLGPLVEPRFKSHEELHGLVNMNRSYPILTRIPKL